MVLFPSRASEETEVLLQMKRLIGCRYNHTLSPMVKSMTVFSGHIFQDNSKGRREPGGLTLSAGVLVLIVNSGGSHHSVIPLL